ncbi:hypothetical protein A1D30_19320 [Acidovorax sp. GW101-3H11]|nr:hypothetical protein A1D30_19320 [Acidovorax sp. GW101-3H11]
MRACSLFYAYFGVEPGSAAAVAALVPVFTDLVANERTGRCAADGAHRAPKNRVAGHAADNSADACAHLGA